MTDNELAKALKEVPGGYEYLGVCSVQICFPLKNGGELRFGWYDDDDPKIDGKLQIDFYEGTLPPGITGPAMLTGGVRSAE